MDNTRFWSIVAGALIVLVVLMDGVFGIAPNLRAAEHAQADRVAVDAANAGHSDQLVALQAKQNGIDELQGTLDQLQQAVPTDAGLPAFIAQLGTLADAHEVQLTALSIGDAQAYDPAPTDAAASETADPAAAAAAAAAAEAGAGTADAAVTAPAAASAQLNAQNLATLTLTLSLAGGYDNLLDFVGGLQQGTRLVSVTNFSSTGESSAVTGAVTFIIYVLHDAD